MFLKCCKYVINMLKNFFWPKTIFKSNFLPILFDHFSLNLFDKNFVTNFQWFSSAEISERVLSLGPARPDFRVPRTRSVWSVYWTRCIER